MATVLIVLLATSCVISFVLWTRYHRSQRADYIRTYMFPPGLIDKLAQRRPELQLKDRQLVARALRQYFLVYLKSGMRPVSMPSQLVDDLWHEFILYTKHYQQFCRCAFGQYMHHTPAAVLSPDRRNNDGLRRTWWFACLEENINPRRATRLPLLFALDAKYNLSDGFVYRTDCSALRSNGDGTVYCAGDFYNESTDTDSSNSFPFSSDSDNRSAQSHSADSVDSSTSNASGDSSIGSDSSGCNGGCSGGCSGGD